MRKWVKQLDQILRGQATQLPALREGRIEVSAGGLCVVLVILGMIYGLCMGCFALTRGGGDAWKQVAASIGKVPMLFLLTLVVTFPSLYVFNALMGSRLTLRSLLRLLVAAMAVMLAVLASFGTIVAFFSFTTSSYPFMVVLNVVVCAVAGFLGLAFLLQTLHRLTVAMGSGQEPLEVPPPLPLPLGDDQQPAVCEPYDPGALDALEGHMLGRHVKTVFRVWVIVFGLVGAQMSWVLRPFIGNPDSPFALFRPRGSNFFESVAHSIQSLLGL